MKDEKWKAGNERGHDDSVEVVTNILPDLKEESKINHITSERVRFVPQISLNHQFCVTR